MGRIIINRAGAARRPSDYASWRGVVTVAAWATAFGYVIYRIAKHLGGK
jgi:hypothetical protein